MLVLTRRVGQKFFIGHDISVEIISVDGSQVRIGISAPKEIVVHREEIYNRINKEGNKK